MQQADEAAQQALARADALLGLATAEKSLADLLEHAVALGAATLPGTAVSLHHRTHDGKTLAVGPFAGIHLPRPREAPLDWLQLEPGDVVVRRDSGEPTALLVLDGLQPEDRPFAERLGEVIGVLLTRGRRQEELQRSERRLVDAQRISHVGSYDFDINSNTNTWSDQLYRIYGREPQSFVATYETFLGMLHPDDVEHVLAVHQHSLATLEPYEMEERVVWPDGQVRVLASWGEVVPDAAGNPARMVGICWDVTEARETEQQLAREALHDRLTGLPNRALLADRLDQALGQVQRHHRSLGVLFIDIDRFKVINDSLGHEAGDEVLVEVARRLSEVMRPGDTVARFGGDEFVVLCEELDHPVQAVAVADRIQQELARPILVLGAELFIAVSTGISLSTGEGDVAGAMLRDADAAMYQAKHAGRARTVMFSAAMRAQAMGRLDTEVELRRALAEGQLRVHYQPLRDVQSGRLVGLEALVRWEHPLRGLVSPDEFIPIAEETGLIVPLGEWVLERACAQLAVWHETAPELSMAVNLSGVQITQPDFIAKVSDVLARTGVRPRAIELEITESVLMRDAEETMAVLHALKALGVGLSVDDFGTGYSSLSYLRKFPVDTLKIDRSFVDGLGQEAEDSAIVQAIQALAVSLGMTTVAEGVETSTQLAVLRELGCLRAQGYWFSRPVTAAEITALLQG